MLVGEILEAIIIQDSNSPFLSSVLLVKKKETSWRFCVNYKELNKITVPVIEELLDELGVEGRVFSKLDLKSGYHLIRMNPANVENTTCHTYLRHYEVLVIAFWLDECFNHISVYHELIFQRVYSKIFTSISIVDEHFKHLRIVLEILKKESLYTNHKKCLFKKNKMEYFGHIISWTRVAINDSKVRVIMN